MPPGKRSQAPGRWREESTRVSQRAGAWLRGGWDARLAFPTHDSSCFGQGWGLSWPPRGRLFLFKRTLAGTVKPLPFSRRLGPDECSSGYFWIHTIIVCDAKFTAGLSTRGCPSWVLHLCLTGMAVMMPTSSRASFWNKLGRLKMTVTPYSS